MRDRRLTATDQGPARSGGSHRGRSSVLPGLWASVRARVARGSRATVAAGVVLGLVGSGMTGAALAADGGSGGSGTPGGGGGTSGNFRTYYAMFDGYTAERSPVQGYMNDSTNWFFNSLGAPSPGALPRNAYTDMQVSCAAALGQAEARRAPGAPEGRSRVVGMYWASAPPLTWGTASVNPDRFRELYNTWVAEGRQGIAAELLAQPRYAGLIESGINEGLGSIPAGSFATTVCIALNESETPLPPLTYDLALSTDKAATFSLAGSSNAVSDNINTGTTSDIRESVWVETRLNWGGREGNGRQVSKSAPIANFGTSASPSFVPGDFGWTSWPAGNFWFDVYAPKQGQMNAEVTHNGQNDPRESWSAAPTAPRKILTSGTAADQLGTGEVLASGMAYDARITARTNGFASSMTITDTVATDQVWIGSATADVANAPYVLDPNGNRVGGASIEISRPAGQVVVSGTVTNIPNAFQAREYTLVVPTYVRPTPTDYTITDSSRVCYTPARNSCIAGNSAQTRKVTPAPNKVWVLDANGALTTADPGKTNQAGSDNKTFAPGSKIGAVVNGSIPASLAENMSQYSLVDDWAGAAKYIDFSDASKARVFLNGADVTAQFTVSVSGTTTTATARPAFLNATKGRASIGTVKLYIEGAFRTDYDTAGQLDRLTNAGSERWNNQVVQTNTPAIYTVTPTPDKAWVLDESGALVTADPNHNNDVGVDTKTFAPGASISAVVNGSVPANLGVKLDSYVITDDWTGAARYVDFSDASKAKVFLDGVNVTSQFTIRNTGTSTVATANAAFLDRTAGRAGEGTVKLVITGVFRNSYDTDGVLTRLTNSGSEAWNGKSVVSNSPPIYTITPSPDKVWVLDENGALSTSDKDWTNGAGADGTVFLPNDAVAAVVNGSIPANLGAPLYGYVLTDDWTGASKYVDFSDASRAKVFANGVDVTAQFTVAVVGTTTVATARPEFLATTANMTSARALKLVISGDFRDDYDTDGEVVQLTNAGSETWNNRTQPTNEPPVYTWTPNPNKQVIGSGEESGDKTYDNINGSSVWPGQKLEYSVGIDLRVPAGTARGIKTLAVEDVYDPHFVPDKHSVEFWDGRDPKGAKPVPKSAYRLVFDDAKHTFTATFTQAWIDANVGVDGANSQWLTQGWLTMRVTGTVSRDIAAGSTVVNQAFQIINGARTGTEIPVVEIPTVTPDKEDLSTDLVDIDGKTLVSGDTILYRLTMDGGPARDQLAYNVHKFGIVDDFDEEYLDLDEGAITVTDKATGADVTGSFNVQVAGGVAYVFAKTVDTEDPFGGVIPGEPQPGDLKAHDEAVIRPLADPIIDQSLLGKDYWVTLKATVSKVEDGYVIENQARQNIQNTSYSTRVVSNPLKDIDPVKDVVVGTGDEQASIDGTEVRLYTIFDYRLTSSVIPANRAYAASQWSMSDTFDKVTDHFTGTWAVRADTDVYSGDELVYAAGDLIEDSGEDKGYFEASFDAETNTFAISATQAYLDLVGTRPDLESGFSVYTQMERIAPAERIENVVDETYNEVLRQSNLVWTKTVEYPGISLKKFTRSEGLEAGDRNTVEQAYAMVAAELGFAAPELLVPEEPVVEPPVETAPEEELPAPVEGEETPEVVALVEAAAAAQAQAAPPVGEGAGSGSSTSVPAPDEDEEEVPDVQKGVQIAFDVANTGDAPLVNVRLADLTHEGRYGAMEDMMCVAPPAQPAFAPVEGAPSETSAVAVGTDALPLVDVDGVRWLPAGTRTTLAVGESVQCRGTLRGMAPGMVHGDTVVATGDSVFSGATVRAEDPWFALAASAPSVSLVKYSFDEGVEQGDRNTAQDALVLTPEQAAGGVRIAFAATNTGDEPLTGLELVDTTLEGSTGTVTGLVWLDPLTGTDADGQEIPNADVVAPDGATVVTEDGVRYLQREASELTDLEVGASALLLGTLTGVEPGTGHVDNAVLTARGTYSGTEVSDSDPWNATLPSPEVPEPVLPEPPVPTAPPIPKGAVTGETVARETDHWFLAGAAAMLVAAAGTALVLRRRRQGQLAEAVADRSVERGGGEGM